MGGWKAVLAASGAIAAVIAAAAIVAVRSGGARGPGPGACEGCNVVIVLLDALRPDRLGCYGYGGGTSPNIDALAQEAIRFDGVFSTSSWTKPAVASLFTGRYPARHGVTAREHRLPDAEVTLAELLAARGYSTAAFVGTSMLDDRANLTQGFGERVLDVDEGRVKAGSRSLTDAVIAHLADAGGSGNLVYVHYMDTHEPYYRPPREERRRTAPGEPGGPPSPARPAGPGGGGPMFREYDDAVRHNDAQIGRLWRALREEGQWEASIVVVIADHGEAFGEHRVMGHYNSVYDEEVRVPFIMKVPGVAPRVVGGVHSLADSLPTLLARLGVPAPPGIDGVDMLSGKREVALVDFEKKGRRLVAARAVGRKLIFDSSTGRRSCYDLAADPLEKEELPGEPPAWCADLGRAVDDCVAAGARRKPEVMELGEDDLRRMRALGYVD